jgi:hypothetical protein
MKDGAGLLRRIFRQGTSQPIGKTPKGSHVGLSPEMFCATSSRKREFLAESKRRVKHHAATGAEDF